MNESRHKMLTEKVLGECDHPADLVREYMGGTFCHKCNHMIKVRTFTTREDMMDLYQAIAEKGLWEEFLLFSEATWVDKILREVVLLTPPTVRANFTAWLFCLTTHDYAAACDRVADFFEERGLK